MCTHVKHHRSFHCLVSESILISLTDRHALTKLNELWYVNLFHLCVYVYMTGVCGHKCHSAHMEVRGQTFCRIGSLLPLYVGSGHQACLSSTCTSQTFSSVRNKFNLYRQDGSLCKGEAELSLLDPHTWRTELIPAAALWPFACEL